MYDIYKEKQEAIQAGKKALESLNRANTELDKASSWGIFDILGGGMISSYMKHDRMRNAQYYLTQAQSDLQRFYDELQDVSMYVGNIEMDGFIQFADIFFDGFFVDLYVQSKIRDAKRQVEQLIYEVDQKLNELYEL